MPKHNYLKLVEAYTQRTIPGMRSAPVALNYHFIVIWNTSKFPETFFWHGDGDRWYACSAARVHKIKIQARNIPTGLAYQSEITALNTIRKGDTLELVPATRPSPMPEEIPKEPVNTLFFKTGGIRWHALPIKAIARKHDISLP